MSKRAPDPSVINEPHLRGITPLADPSELRAARVLGGETEDRQQAVEQSVWEEPGQSRELTARPAGAVSRARWLRDQREKVSFTHSWGVTLAVALAAAPFSVIGLFMGGGKTVFSIMAIVVFGPVAEEMMKIALPLHLAERRPYLLRGRLQIALCGLLSGLTFASVENLLYLKVYIAEPSPLLVQWRWSVCVALHMGCTLINSLGVMRVWQAAWQPETDAGRTASSVGRAASLGFPYAVTAAVIHGGYNGLMVLLSMSDHRF